MTLAIGSTLIGVAIDYPILLLTHRVLAPDEPPEQRRPAGLDGRSCSAASPPPPGSPPSPGRRSRACARWPSPPRPASSPRWPSPATVLPPLLAGRHAPRAPLLWRGVARSAMRALGWLQRHTRCALGLVVIAVAGLCAGRPAAPALAGLARRAQRRRPRPEGRDRSRARPRLAGRRGAPGDRRRRATSRRPCASTTRSPHRLERARTARGSMAARSSLHAFLWSADLQRAQPRGARRRPRPRRRARSPRWRARASSPRRSPRFAARRRRAARARPPTPPLRLADLRGLAARAARPPVHRRPRRRASGVLTFVRGVKRPRPRSPPPSPSCRARASSTRPRFLDETYARFRVQTLQAIGVGLVLILLVLFDPLPPAPAARWPRCCPRCSRPPRRWRSWAPPASRPTCCTCCRCCWS